MDDLEYGTRNKRGDWKPRDPLKYPPLFVWPLRPIATLRWLFAFDGYILPWYIAYALVACGVWAYLTPSIVTLRSSNYEWLAYLFWRNILIALVVYGAWHLRLYTFKLQGKKFKYNSIWPAKGNRAFLFKHQNVDNVIWSLGSGVPIWTAYEAGMLWLFANGYIPFVGWWEHPIYCIVLLLLIPFIENLHFYVIHRFLHWPPMYRWVHSLHHNNVNPGPWSGLAMHPIEHLLYFSGVLVYVVIPSHPIHAIFHLFHSALDPAQVHAGFDKLVVGEKAVDTHGYQHYLHHKYFECNYSGGLIPLDKWFGTFHDGSPEAQEAMNRRFKERARKQVS
ncbi:sterol desaturase family protein [Mesorhizobium sp. M4B.F.Ca.ET.190.01.1.1]|uniref:sterol desaturase family protein n=1 Tax=unclassified Mesorhizobium TaxID=325217 RepID=UPI000FCB2806|nr:MULTISPECIES: sterol desaturase family protein [unclassified Mesorhizobium]RUW85050.1 sterol desaturase family protein [Mesorhizobium sp. M1E.F.Ca.ET.063.01.1.1]RWF38377.1 MAG: sterol desaturase family protein [Mesorhizobium sp.]RWO96711.1 MAG: sterol desaturase family protein [Mesorhizobium sp.]TGQ99395.1 sterol desaturase family protein [Mesorhizobium sp. M4B.F.Ca.ET.200.01.1.1]TGS11685.1 sterol desaturase family protein [Mesorhizobium sp. M4B.F.Ca.ET.190.01.1.1]